PVRDRDIKRRPDKRRACHELLRQLYRLIPLIRIEPKNEICLYVWDILVEEPEVFYYPVELLNTRCLPGTCLVRVIGPRLDARSNGDTVGFLQPRHPRSAEDGQ